MERLSKAVTAKLPSGVSYYSQEHLPEKVLQFGEGNFLRGFIDWMIQQMNKQGLFHGRVVAIQPTPHGKVVPKINAQEGLYTSALRGIENGKNVEQFEVNSTISRGINPYTNWQDVLEVAASSEIEFVFSNTTEAGLSYLKEDYDGQTSPLSFPGKVAACLHYRYQKLGGSSAPGWTVIPCELVEENGQILKDLVLRISEEWGFSASFIDWLKHSNRFCDTLVDRIVTGYPRERITYFREKLGYEDELLTVGEPYHLFIIDAVDEVAKALPFDKAGLNVKWGDVSPFRELKVRLLNGPHTMMFAASYLSGADTVLEAMEDHSLRSFIEQGLYQEIYPLVRMEEKEKESFVHAVIERFLNPYNKHYLTDIGMNAIYKFKTRLIPTLLQYVEANRTLPQALTFSLAALFVYYRSERRDGAFLVGKRGETEYQIRDQKEALAAMEDGWNAFDGSDESLSVLTKRILSQTGLWGCDLLSIPGLAVQVTEDLRSILDVGTKEALKKKFMH